MRIFSEFERSLRPDPQTPYLSSNLQKLLTLSSMKREKWRPQGIVGLRDWRGKLLGAVVKGTQEKMAMKKENERKERDLCIVVWLKANRALFVMRSRWGPTLATQWQPPTSTTTGEWLEWWWGMMAKQLGKGNKTSEMTEEGQRY